MTYVKQGHGTGQLLLHVLDLLRIFHKACEALRKLQALYTFDLFTHIVENTERVERFLKFGSMKMHEERPIHVQLLEAIV